MSRSPMRALQQQQYANSSSSMRSVMGNWGGGEKTVNIDGTDPDHIKALIEDLEAKRDQLVTILKSELADIKMQQEEALKTGLMKLPKSIRQMTVQEFNLAHGCDILAILKSKDGVEISAQKKRDYNMTVAETPEPRSRKGITPGSALRTARKGEGLFSVNGSPIEPAEVGSVIATVTKKRKGNESANANIEINVGDGRFISLNNPSGVTELDSSMKASAASQLKVLQDQMESLMAVLTS